MNKCLVRITKLLTTAIVGILLVLNGCFTPNHEGFAIYLTKGDIPPAQMPALSHVYIAEPPVIGMNDVISYNTQTHELKLTANAYDSISKLEIPVEGRSFVVCVDRKPVYWGAFWTPISSISFDGVTVWKPFSSQETKIITLELGYPSSNFYGGVDPRNNPELIKSFEQSGKLITRLSLNAVKELPRSMKGYELYSWSEDSEWHFTLITGTNRSKTVEEIIYSNDFISESGWVQIHGIGEESINTILSKLPQNEHVSWLTGMWSEQISQGSINFTLPEAPIIDSIKEHARYCGLDLAVQTP